MARNMGIKSRRGTGRMTWNEIEQLRMRARELELTRERLSRLYFSQVEAGKARMERLHRLLEVVTQLNSTLDLDVLLDAIVRAVQAALGFRVVLLRVLDPETKTLKAQAFAGLGVEARARLEAEDVTLDDFLSWIADEFRVGRSYFISHTHAFAGRLPKGIRSNLGPREPWEWHEDDVLLVPLYTKDGEIIAYLSVDDPGDRLVPSRETIELLEVFGNHVVVALENARLYQTLQEHTLRLEEANTRLGELTRLKTNFLSAISHELRTPLASIRAYVDTLRDSPADADPEVLSEAMEVVADESVRLEALIDSVLSFSALESGSGPSSTRVELSTLVRDCVQRLQPAAKSKEVDLKTRLPRKEIHLDGDGDLLKQMVLQLGGNAIKFTPQGGKVTISMHTAEKNVRISVRDTGIGIAGEELGRIFERFYQIEGGLSRRYGGTGLGLALCKSVSEWHGGEISVTSQPGQGSCFQVLLPRVSRPRASVVESPSRGRQGGNHALGMTLEVVSEVLEASTVVLLTPQTGGEIVPRAAVGIESKEIRGLRLCAGEGVAGTVIESGEALVTEDAEGDPRFLDHRREPYRRGQLLAAPVLIGERVAGALIVAFETEQQGEEGTETQAGQEAKATPARLSLLGELAKRVAAVLAKVDRLHQEEAAVQVAVETLRSVLVHLRRDRRHAPDRVRFATGVGERLGLEEREISELAFAALVQDVALSRPELPVLLEGDARPSETEALHDIATAPPGELAERLEREFDREGGTADLRAEEESQQRHPAIGVEVLSPLETDGSVRKLILAHHEWFNGQGYPNGLSGEQIPKGARILAVVDALEELLHGRVGRPAVPVEEAVHELCRDSGRRFDASVVEALKSVLVAEGRLDERVAAQEEAA
jgi:signal transduction histidine kinase